MAKEKKKKKSAGKTKRSIFHLLKFQQLGKYFLLFLLLIVQGFTAYKIVDKNYESVYRYTQDFFPAESGRYDLEQIVVNPADTNGKRFLLVEISLELVDKETEAMIAANNSKIRSNLIEYLSARAVSELQGISGKEDLRIELIKIINQTIDTRSVRNLYYSKYVMQ